MAAAAGRRCCRTDGDGGLGVGVVRGLKDDEGVEKRRRRANGHFGETAKSA